MLHPLNIDEAVDRGPAAKYDMTPRHGKHDQRPMHPLTYPESNEDRIVARVAT